MHKIILLFIMYEKIFVIGFNKTATSSIHKLFIKNKLLSQHNGSRWQVDDYQCFSDNGDLRNFKELDEKYENSIFILNTRKLNKWIISRFKHGQRQYEKTRKKNWAWPCREELVYKWLIEREAHHMNLLEHFKNNPEKLIIVSTEKSDFLEFISNHININHYQFEPRNVIKTTDEHNDMIECVNRVFNEMYYNEAEIENCLVKDVDLTNHYLTIYKNNIHP